MREANAIDKHIGARIRMRRQQLAISQMQLGEKLDISSQQVQKYEKGINRVGGGRMAQIAEMLEVEVGFFYLDAPDAKKLSRRAPASLLDDFIASKEGLMIAQAFVRIADPRVRHTIAASIEDLSKVLHPDRKLQAAE